jgi:hypothetical protein
MQVLELFECCASGVLVHEGDIYPSPVVVSRTKVIKIPIEGWMQCTDTVPDGILDFVLASLLR